MLKKFKLAVTLAVLSTLIVGCAGVGSNSISQGWQYGVNDKGELKNIFLDPSVAELQLALLDRGLYLQKTGHTALVDPNTCKTESVAHRGDYRYEENSRRSIQYGLYGGFDTIEIDVFEMYGDRYIVSHDSKTGRASGRTDGKQIDLTRIYFQEVAYIGHRGKDGQLLRERIPSLREAIAVVMRDSNGSQKLNIELKGSHSHSRLMDIDDYLQAALGSNYYYTSLNLEILEKIRTFNSNVYLGFIQSPDNDSVELKKKAYRKGVQKDYTYLRYKNRAEMLASLGTNYYQGKRRIIGYTPKGLTALKSILGQNSGIHVDIRTYVKTPYLLSNAHSRGMKVQTYTINDNEYHMRELLKVRKKNRMPDGVIADMSTVKLCQIERGGFPSAHKNDDKITTDPLAKVIAMLPDDADFDRMSEQQEYVADGFYRTYLGDLKALPGKEPTVVKKSTIQKAAAVKKDTGATAGGKKTIVVDFPID